MSRPHPTAAVPSDETGILTGDTSMKPPPPQQQKRPIVMADLNADPPETDAYAFSSSAVPISRKIAFKDAEALDVEASQSKKVGKGRSKTGKVEYPPDCGGADTDADQNGQGVAASREEKVSSLKTAILAYEKAAEILLRSEEEIDRPELLSVVQLHHAQCILLESLENCTSDKELEPQELDEICSKLRESMETDVRQASVWNTLGLILLRSGRLQRLLNSSTPCVGAGANADARSSADQVMAADVAKECLLAAAKAEPRAAHIWTNLANAYYLIGDHRTSGKCLEKAGKLDPNCLATRYAVGVHRIRDAERSQNPNEQLTWAGNEMASVLREGDSIVIEPPIACAGLALVHKAQHEIAAVFEIDPKELLEVKERAMYSLKQAIGEDPDDAVQWHQIGLHCLCTQQLKMSQTYLKAAVARLNDCVYTWSNLGISLQLLEESSQAEEVYKHALSLATSQQAHAIFSNLGNFYRQLRKFESAKAMFSKALELQPGYAPAYNNLGLVFVAEGHLEEAKFCFNKANESDPFLDAAKSNIIKVASICKTDTSLLHVPCLTS
ncbi:hypothetical protein DH2020_042656 [Rehmannia glutinosa]|uniref:Uncharacterized protein n=1 Tax=Rehmannia glutinosa TaxID=99300 RepID=A0ABR0UMU1_REHGL